MALTCAAPDPELFRNTVSEDLFGLRAVLIRLIRMEEGLLHIPVHPQEYAERIRFGEHCSRADLFRIALENMAGQLPPRIFLPERYPACGCPGEIPGDPAATSLYLRKRPPQFRRQGLILTNGSRRCGSATILYPGLAEHLCGILRSDLYLVFSGPEQVLLFRTMDITLSQLCSGAFAARDPFREAAPGSGELPPRILCYRHSLGFISCPLPGQAPPR